MSIADSSETRLAYINEAAWNTTPATPAFQNIRMTDEDFAKEKATGVSNEIRPDAEVADLVRLGVSASGGFGFELSHGDFDTLFEHTLRGTFAAAVTGATQLDVGSTSTFTRPAGSFLKDGFQAGDSITTTDFTDAADNGTFTIQTVTDTVVTTVETTLVAETGGGDETMTAGATDVLKGALEKKSFTIEKTFESGGTDTYFRFTGCRTGQLDLNFAANEFVTGRLAYTGGDGSKAVAAIGGATYAAAGVAPVMSAVDVANITIAGVTMTLFVQSFTMSLNNNLRAQNAVGSLGAVGVAYGRREITGSLTAYLDEQGAGELYDAFDAHTDASLLWSVSDGANTYNFRLPRTKLATATTPTPGNSQDIFLNIDYQALVDTEAGASIIVTK